jgi:hypothetical protein
VAVDWYLIGVTSLFQVGLNLFYGFIGGPWIIKKKYVNILGKPVFYGTGYSRD